MPVLDSQERSPTIIHLHWFAFVRDIGIILAGVVFPPLIAILFLHNVIWGDVADAIIHLTPLFAVLWALFVWVTIAIVWTRYYLSLWIITDTHLVYVNQINLFMRQVASWEIEKIEGAVSSSEDPIGPILDYGTVWIKTPEAGEREYIIATPIPHPEFMRDMILGRLSLPQTPAPTENISQLENTSETQADLIRSISHEMKGHLTRSQVTFASIIAGDFGEVPERLKNIAGMALADTREGVETVMDILNSANIKKGTLAMQKETFDLLEAIRESVGAFHFDAGKRGLMLRFKDKIGSCLIEGDRAKLMHHVFRNLIDNAIRYTPARSTHAGQIGVIDVDLTWDLSFATFSVIDNGVGISPIDMQHLFTEGGKGSESTRVNPQSTGYGLYVARMVVEAHGGKIWAESDGLGLGSRFFVKLPLHPASAQT